MESLRQKELELVRERAEASKSETALGSLIQRLQTEQGEGDRRLREVLQVNVCHPVSFLWKGVLKTLDFICYNVPKMSYMRMALLMPRQYFSILGLWTKSNRPHEILELHENQKKVLFVSIHVNSGMFQLNYILRLN